MTDPGILKERLFLEAPVDVPDDSGGVERSYAAVAFVWASVTALDGRPDNADAGAGATARCRITIRRGPEVTTRHCFRQGDRLWRVVSLREVNSPGPFTLIDAEAHVD